MRNSETLSGSALPSLSSLPEGTQVYDYNALDQLLSTLNPLQTFIYDADGNLTQGYTPEGYVFTAEYDAEDRMTSLEYTDSSSVVHRTDYQYSGDGFLAVVQKKENGALVDEIRIVRDGLLAVQERDGSNTVLREYIWGLNLGGGIGGLLNLNQGGQNYAYLYDGKGNVEAVLDGSQAVVAAYRYGPFGKLLAKTGSLEQPFGFSTKRYDAQNGLIEYGFRRYAPAIGRWTTRDPLGEAGGINLYAFVGNNPVNWVDPNGTSPTITLSNAIWYEECHQLARQMAEAKFTHDREHHCYASCIYTRCIMKKASNNFSFWHTVDVVLAQPNATALGGFVREFKPSWEGWRQRNEPLFFRWGIKDAIGDMLLNSYGVSLSYVFWKSCEELCTDCPRLDNWK
jgi:RHS repeat-associated protein